MASQGPLSPGTLASDASFGTWGWINPGNAGASDGSYATSDRSGAPVETQYHKSTNFGFSIPGGATIDGILVEVERNSDGGADTDLRARIVKGGTIGSTDKSTGASWPASDAYQSFGGAADLWDETWTDSDINSIDFGFVIAATISGTATARIDHVRITVYYTTAAGTSVSWFVA